MRLRYRALAEIVECEVCGLVFARATDAPSVDPYTESYYRGDVYADYLTTRETILRNAQRALREIEGLTAGRRLLDVGCATGFFLEAAAQRGWTVQGLEASAYASAQAREQSKLPVLQGSIEDPPRGLLPADVVTLWDTIEHLERPDQALIRIRELMGPQGLLVITTGDFASLVRRVTGRRWRLFGDRTHHFFFTPRTLESLLARAGFRAIHVDHRGKRVGLGMILQQAPIPQ
ncbi:MAG TPA: class I SAM-dependent methyltransferase, partial [Vicinamibacteria bacterium]|nr:class I SAM-dependent methyltransferase [Vicinamibacteria bacterium]